MNIRSLVMNSVLLSLATAPVQAVADVTFYGKANVSLQRADERGNKKNELVSNASRIGVQGAQKIGEGLEVIYRAEYQTEIDDGANSNGHTFSQRNIYVGVRGAVGTLMAGMFDTPTKVLQEKIDLFNDLEGDITTVLRGEVRAKNIVQYASPVSWGRFATSVAYITKETDGADDGYSASVFYATPNVYAGIAMDQDVEAEGVDLVRAAVRVSYGPTQIGLLGEWCDNGVVSKDGYIASLLWEVAPKWATKLQYGSSDVKMVGGETFSFGIDYRVSSKVTVFGYHTTVENNARIEAANSREDRYAGIGIDVKF